jgi:ubiquinone/menaquinone biosynthesis C-methylase UbiE
MEVYRDVCGMDHVKWLDNGFRRMIHNPRALFGRYVKPGGLALDIGCGPGSFTLALAKLTGVTGKVIAVDLQEPMLDLTRNKIDAAGMSGRVEFHRCSSDSLGLEVQADFILTFYMVHESPQPLGLVNEVCALLKPGGYWFLAEPKFHVSKNAYCEVVDRCLTCGLAIVEEKGIISRMAVFTRPCR